MSTVSGYKVHKELRFEVCGMELSVVRLDEETLYVEEINKDESAGYMGGPLVLLLGKWVWEDEWTRTQFYDFAGENVADGIPAYLNANPIPDIDKL